MTDIQVRMHSRRRQRGALIQKLQHAVPAPQLLLRGIQRVTERVSGLAVGLGTAEILSGGLVIVALVRAIRAMRTNRSAEPHASHGVDWIDLALAGMLATEAAAHWHETGRIPRPTVLTAVVMLALGLLHGRLAARAEARRSLRLTDEGLTVGGRFFSRFTAKWPEILRIDIDATHASIVRRDGVEQRLDFRDLQNPQELRSVLESARARITTNEAAGPALD